MIVYLFTEPGGPSKFVFPDEYSFNLRTNVLEITKGMGDESRLVAFFPREAIRAIVGNQCSVEIT